MDLQVDYADLCMTILDKFGTDPKFSSSARMLLDYAIVRLAKIGMSLQKASLISGDAVRWEGILEKFSKEIFAGREETVGETVKMVWPFHPAAAWLCARGKAEIAGTVTAAADKLIAEGHRNMEDFGTYPESSGTGLILYALGKGIRTGFFSDEKYLSAFRRGIKALVSCVCVDGSVQNCCGSCLCPGYNGTTADYQLRSWILNDTHAFGGPILAFSEAIELQKKGIL